jgi:hypothetical protein
MAQANLDLARAEATAAAAPPDAIAIARICDRAEELRRKLWRDQIARDMAKAAEMAWEVIHVQEIDLDILEGESQLPTQNAQLIRSNPMPPATMKWK